eukprot:1138706-Pelagomonas_calceolata.AAC.2
MAMNMVPNDPMLYIIDQTALGGGEWCRAAQKDPSQPVGLQVVVVKVTTVEASHHIQILYVAHFLLEPANASLLASFPQICNLAKTGIEKNYVGRGKSPHQLRKRGHIGSKTI